MTTKEIRGRHGRLEVERQERKGSGISITIQWLPSEGAPQVIEIQCADRIESDQYADAIWDVMAGEN